MGLRLYIISSVSDSGIEVAGAVAWKRISLFTIIVWLWIGQLGWLAWHFAPEVADLAGRLATGRVGEAIRQEDNSYRWFQELKKIIPPEGAYGFVDCYEAGIDIQARYHLYPRRLVRLKPTVTPSFLYERLHRAQANFLILRECNPSPYWRFLFNPKEPVFQPLPQSGAAAAFTVDARRLIGGFYD